MHNDFQLGDIVDVTTMWLGKIKIIRGKVVSNRHFGLVIQIPGSHIFDINNTAKKVDDGEALMWTLEH